MRTAKQWGKVGQRPHHGILVPLFSLRVKGEGRAGFLDLIPLIDWCKKISFDTLQLLPLNDTGEDPSPYDPISAFALDPLYLTIPHQTGDSRLSRRETKAKKIEWLRAEYKKNRIDLTRFIQEHRWLKAYGEFLGDLDFHSFVQYHCFSQLARVKNYATQQGIFLMGDLPHLVSEKSSDVWAHPDLFRNDFVAGAPPDDYNPIGQKWGFPLYDWNAMRKEKFAWWKERLQSIERLYHIYRLDHLVGFFRIWGIPPDKKANKGHFIPENRDLWAPLGREILEMMIDASPLLPIGEDLGIIPEEVYPLLRELGICGTKVIRWEKEIPYKSYEPLSLTTLSTPDMEPLQVYQPDLTREGRIEMLKKAHSTSSYFHINLLQEYLRVFPELSWPDPLQDRINLPGILSDANWSYHFRPTLEEIVTHPPLTSLMRSFVEKNIK